MYPRRLSPTRLTLRARAGSPAPVDTSTEVERILCGPFADHCEASVGDIWPSPLSPSSRLLRLHLPVMVVCRIVWAALRPSYCFPQARGHAADSKRHKMSIDNADVYDNGYKR
ncbi:hypothetical protein PRIPAC_71152 [Pristionchus pacificus]|uniref:Uncharacterized protein n=1 Tax=Pristionchus pacificus TaxID=54126 RepID=A0A2A6B574_PRIPA|nr:hypothetical protein PRIPAC_71152 [Pristionchus pacificus]|eukprot:PDM61024.1 hypothetical protein PRIPAC_54830 [Pristionchus pacificus]